MEQSQGNEEAAPYEAFSKNLRKGLNLLGIFEFLYQDFCDVQHFYFLFFAGVFDAIPDHGHAEGASYCDALGSCG